MKKIDQYINDERATMHSPNLEGRILSQLKTLEQGQATISKRNTVWQTLAVAASIAIVIVTGIAIGGSYKQGSSSYSALMINDKHIENLSGYTANEE